MSVCSWSCLESISFFHFEFSPSIGASQRICIKTAPAAWWVCWVGRREGNRVAGSLAVLFLSGRLELLLPCYTNLCEKCLSSMNVSLGALNSSCSLSFFLIASRFSWPFHSRDGGIIIFCCGICKAVFILFFCRRPVISDEKQL